MSDLGEMFERLCLEEEAYIETRDRFVPDNFETLKARQPKDAEAIHNADRGWFEDAASGTTARTEDIRRGDDGGVAEDADPELIRRCINGYRRLTEMMNRIMNAKLN